MNPRNPWARMPMILATALGLAAATGHPAGAQGMDRALADFVIQDAERSKAISAKRREADSTRRERSKAVFGDLVKGLDGVASDLAQQQQRMLQNRPQTIYVSTPPFVAAPAPMPAPVAAPSAPELPIGGGLHEIHGNLDGPGYWGYPRDPRD